MLIAFLSSLIDLAYLQMYRLFVHLFRVKLQHFAMLSTCSKVIRVDQMMPPKKCVLGVFSLFVLPLAAGDSSDSVSMPSCLRLVKPLASLFRATWSSSTSKLSVCLRKDFFLGHGRGGELRPQRDFRLVGSPAHRAVRGKETFG